MIDAGGIQLDKQRGFAVEQDVVDRDLGPCEFDPLLRSIAQNAADMVLLLDRDCLIRFINRTVPDLTVEQVIGQSVLNYVPPYQQPAARAMYERVAQTGQPTQFLSVYQATDGATSHWHSHIMPWSRGGRVIGFAVVARDITFKTVEREHSDCDPFFELSEDMLCVLGEGRCFERVNRAFETTLGYGEGDLIGQSSLDLVHPDDRARSAAAADALVAGAPAFTFENRVRGRDGAYRVISWRGVAEPGCRRSARILAVGRDVTDYRRLETQLQQAHRLETIGRLTSGVAHDFGNLLQVIRLSTRAALEHAEPEGDLGAALSDIEQAAKRAGDLTQRLLSIARREPVNVAPLDLNRLCGELEGLLRRAIPAQIEFELSLHGGPCIVVADHSQIEHVVINLCLNARDAMSRGGKLRIVTAVVRADAELCRDLPRATAGAPFAMLSVEDSGGGMSQDVQARLFEPFFSTKPPGHGNGLGLATAHANISRHGGLLRVRSRPGVGSTVEVLLPAVALEPAAALPSEAPVETAANGTILIAEDEDLVRTGVQGLLEQAGYRVLPATNGREAIELYRGAGRVDLLLLDVSMPQLNGPDTLAEIRKLDPAARAIFTSGYDVPPPDGNSDVLLKPYDPVMLLGRIARVLGGQ